MSPTRKKYAQIKIDGESIQRSRLARFYVYGIWPKEWIDHLNGDSSDDRISNLREASPFQNKGNTKISRSNTSGYKGVSFNKKSKNWRSSIKIKGKTIVLGHFLCPKEAHQRYLDAAIEVFGEFARAA